MSSSAIATSSSSVMTLYPTKATNDPASGEDVIETTLGDILLAETTSLDNGKEVKKGKEGPYKCRATQTTPRFDLLEPDEPVAFDDEFQIYKGPGMLKWRHRHGRPTVYSRSGHVILDVYMTYPNEEGVEKRCPPKRFGVTRKDLIWANGAIPAEKGEKWLKRIFHGRTVIVHGGEHDLTSFFFETDAFSAANGVKVVDTQVLYRSLKPSGKPGLANTALAILEKDIQAGGVHSPVEDAVTTMELYLRKFPYDDSGKKSKGEDNKKDLLGFGRAARHPVRTQEVSLEAYIKPQKQGKKNKRTLEIPVA